MKASILSTSKAHISIISKVLESFDIAGIAMKYSADMGKMWKDALIRKMDANDFAILPIEPGTSTVAFELSCCSAINQDVLILAPATGSLPNELEHEMYVQVDLDDEASISDALEGYLKFVLGVVFDGAEEDGFDEDECEEGTEDRTLIPEMAKEAIDEDLALLNSGKLDKALENSKSDITNFLDTKENSDADLEDLMLKIEAKLEARKRERAATEEEEARYAGLASSAQVVANRAMANELEEQDLVQDFFKEVPDDFAEVYNESFEQGLADEFAEYEQEEPDDEYDGMVVSAQDLMQAEVSKALEDEDLVKEIFNAAGKIDKEIDSVSLGDLDEAFKGVELEEAAKAAENKAAQNGEEHEAPIQSASGVDITWVEDDKEEKAVESEATPSLEEALSTDAKEVTVQPIEGAPVELDMSFYEAEWRKKFKEIEAKIKDFQSTTLSIIENLFHEYFETMKSEVFDRSIKQLFEKLKSGIIVENRYKVKDEDIHFSLWIDEIDELIGNPLVVETKSGIVHFNDLKACHDNLKHFINNTTAEAGLLIYDSLSSKPYELEPCLSPPIFVINLDELINKLTDHTLSQILLEMWAEMQPK